MNVIADYAKVRAVIEDRRSMLGALAAGARFVHRHRIAVSALYLANALVLAVAFAVYLLVAPGSHGGDWRLLAVLAIGQAWILMRIVTRLAFLSTSAALVPAICLRTPNTPRRPRPSGPTRQRPKPSRTPRGSAFVARVAQASSRQDPTAQFQGPDSARPRTRRAEPRTRA